MMDDFIFVVGCPRSGTKFVKRVLNRHPDIAICPETHFFSGLFHRGVMRQTKHLFPCDSDEKVAELFALLQSQTIHGSFWQDPTLIDYEAVQAAFATSDRSYAALLSTLLQQFAQQRGASVAGEKTPTHLFHVDTLLTWFPHSRVIHILRDPRSVVASQLKKKEKKQSLRWQTRLTVFGGTLLEWRWALRHHHRYQRRYNGRYHLIQFEQLYSDHVATVQALCRFLEIDFYPEMLNPPVKGSSFQERVAHNPIDGWQSYLSQGSVALVNFLLRPQLKAFGYLPTYRS